MIAEDLANRRLLFDPNLDLEEVHELPGKDSMAAVLESLTRSKIACTKLVQDSHGWCFHIHGDDGRTYLMELIYRCTTDQTSEWVFTCDRLSWLRFWEWGWFKRATTSVGLEQRYWDLVVEILVSQHGFEKTHAA
jgi:hypothetical protein